METRRYIIITEAPDSVSSLLSPIRRDLAQRYQSFSALEYPLHVTLRTGVVVPLEKRGEVFDAFRSISRGTGPVRIKSDGCMFEEYAPGKYLAGYAVKREPSLMELNRRLLSYREYRKSDKNDFRPHITLLFDDLTREAFRDFEESVTENRIQLPGAIEWEASEFGLYYYVPGNYGDEGSWIPEEIIPLRA